MNKLIGRFHEFQDFFRPYLKANWTQSFPIFLWAHIAEKLFVIFTFYPTNFPIAVPISLITHLMHFLFACKTLNTLTVFLQSLSTNWTFNPLVFERRGLNFGLNFRLRLKLWLMCFKWLLRFALRLSFMFLWGLSHKYFILEGFASIKCTIVIPIDKQTKSAWGQEEGKLQSSFWVFTLWYSSKRLLKILYLIRPKLRVHLLLHWKKNKGSNKLKS